MTFLDDDRPKKPVIHVIGEDLTLLSIAEIELRIAMLHAEISRLEQAKAGKSDARQMADSFFKS